MSTIKYQSPNVSVYEKEIFKSFKEATIREDISNISGIYIIPITECDCHVMCVAILDNTQMPYGIISGLAVAIVDLFTLAFPRFDPFAFLFQVQYVKQSNKISVTKLLTGAQAAVAAATMA